MSCRFGVLVIVGGDDDDDGGDGGGRVTVQRLSRNAPCFSRGVQLAVVVSNLESGSTSRRRSPTVKRPFSGNLRNNVRSRELFFR
ncbi:unnamed protein product [Nippostrongylus brasiliensis]|uniref:Secreted protein n=1 Tax=Nippostrongylus brasiliensis TaxID=27835 RepID=A0A0N4XXB0_NIPBR|nr:unnamed protein product [Nippostrongylus brasiliensis]